MATKNLGEQYISFLNNFAKKEAVELTEELELLFAPDVTKTINSLLICKDRNELIKQMQDCIQTYGNVSAVLLEALKDVDGKRVAIRFEATFSHDNETDVVISILTCDNAGLIKEINEVSSGKASYQWQP